MIKEEAYNKMSEGYMVTHKSFAPKDYLYMDDQFIIRNSTGDTFENEWDVLNNPEWAVDWYIYSGKHNKALPAIVKKPKMDASKLPMYDMDTHDRKEIGENNEPSIEDESDPNICDIYEDHYIGGMDRLAITMEEKYPEEPISFSKPKNKILTNIKVYLPIVVLCILLGAILYILFDMPLKNIIIFMACQFVFMVIKPIIDRRMKK